MANKNISGDVNVEFTEAQSRQSLESGESVKTLFGKLRKWLTDLKPVAFSGSYNDLSNKPTTTVNNGTLTIKQNDVTIGTFSANQDTDTDVNIISYRPKIYGYKINKHDSNPSSRVTYLNDAVGMTPAHMNFSSGSFDYGSWGDVWFIKNNRPVVFGGGSNYASVSYELNHTDFSKKIDGTAATIGGDYHCMSEIPLVYVKRYEDADYNYVLFSENKIDEDYTAQAHTNKYGKVQSKIYLPMFKGSMSSSRLVSRMGNYPSNKQTASTCISAASYNGNADPGWTIWDKSKIDLIMDLIVLITKSTDCRGTIGNGVNGTYDYSDTNFGMLRSGYEMDGVTRSPNAQFYGYDGGTASGTGKHHMIAFYLEDLWGNRMDWCLGYNIVNNKYYIKMSPPYALTPDETYIETNIFAPSEGWLKNISTGIYGSVPIETGAASSTWFASPFAKTYSDDALATFGGFTYYSFSRGRSGRYWDFYPSNTQNWGIGGSLCYIYNYNS